MIQVHLPGVYTTVDIDMPAATPAGSPAPAATIVVVSETLVSSGAARVTGRSARGADAILVEVPGHEVDV